MKMKTLVMSAALMMPPLAASAADLGVNAAPYAPVWNWTGIYGGVVGSAGVMSSEHADQWCDMTCSTPVLRRFGGGIGGTLGYNFQLGRHFMWGVEGDASCVSFKTNHFDAGSNYFENIGAKWN